MFALLLLAMGLIVANAAEAVVGGKGPVGDKGPIGNKGPAGNVGAKGDAGLKGPVGDKGLTGNTGLPGGKGDQGLPGDKGLQGDKGDAGTNGTNGGKGDQGLPGDKGLQGDKGDAGAASTVAGPPGAHAVSGAVVGQLLVWNGTAWTPTASGCLAPYIIGDTAPDGIGKVFYVDGSGCHGLEVQTLDALAPITQVVHMDRNAADTAAAAYNLPSCTTNPQLTPSCWHVPNAIEWSYLFEQRDAFFPAPCDYARYWSASSPNNAMHVFLGLYKNQGSEYRENLCVRAVRAF